MEETIKIREKGQYETNTEYLQWINQQIEKQNNLLMQKNSEIANLKSQVANLEAEKAKIEKSQSDSTLTQAEVELRTLIDDLSKVIADNKNISSDPKIDNLISKVDDAIMKYSSIESEYAEIKSELSKPVNIGNIQEYIVRQDEIESMIKEIYENVEASKKEILDSINSNKNVVPEFNNMEQAVNLISDHAIEPEQEVSYAKPADEQINNYVESQNNFEQQMNNEIDQDQTNEINNSFDQIMNPEVNVNSTADVVAPVAPTSEVETPSVVPFVNESETITPDASVLNSVLSPETTESTQVEDENVIEETNNQGVVPSEEETNQILEGAEKVESIEEASPEIIKQATQPLTASSIKARRDFVNKISESKKIEDLLRIDSWLQPGVEMSDDMKNYFNESLNVDLQQAVGRSR